MSLQNRKVAVIGAGIGGLATALALARLGAQVQVFERASAIKEYGAGLQISANGIAVLQALGLQVVERNRKNMPPNIEFRHYQTDRVITRLPLNATSAQPYVQLHRADLIGDLAKGCKDAGVAIHLGHKAVVADAQQGVLVAQTTQRFDAIIAADGIRSDNRMIHLAGNNPQYTGQAAWRVTVAASDYPAFKAQSGTRLYLGPKRHVVVYPLRDRSLINVVAVQERAEWTAEGWSYSDSNAAFQRAFGGWCDYVSGLLSIAQGPKLWGFFAHPELASWSRGRVVLVGDAAHPMLPYMAQGACMALEDAWVLAQSMEREDTVSQAFEAFEARRKPRATKVQRTSQGNGALFHISNPLLRPVMNAGITVVGKIAPWVLTSRYNWIYDCDVTKE